MPTVRTPTLEIEYAISDPKSQARGPTLERGSIAGVRTQGSGTAYLRRIAREYLALSIDRICPVIDGHDPPKWSRHDHTDVGRSSCSAK